MRPVVLALCFACLGHMIAAAGSAPPKPGPEAPSSVFRGRITPQEFIGDKRILTGPGWTLTKYKTDDRLWGSRLEADGKVVKDIGDCGQFEDWMRFYLWPPDDEPKRLLMVFRFGGGAHGPRNLDVIDLLDGFRTLLETNDAVNADGGLQDLDGDGWPEVLGNSICFDYFEFPIPFSHADSPFPQIIMAYDPNARRHLCANHRFPEQMQERTQRAQAKFREHWTGEAKIPAEVVLEPYGGRADAFRALVHWVVYVCYEGREDDAFAILEQYADPVLTVFTKHAIQQQLRRDRNYQKMRELQRRSTEQSPPME